MFCFKSRKQGGNSRKGWLWIGLFDKNSEWIESHQGFFFRVRGRYPTPIKSGKMHNKGPIWGKFSVNIVLHHFIFV